MASLPQTSAVGLSMVHAFEHAFAHAAIGMALVDMDGRLLRVNEALCRITGFTREHLEHRSLGELSHPADVDLDAGQIVRLVGGDLPSYQIEKRYVHAEGHELWVLLTVSLVRDDWHRPLYLISQLQDISERKELERRLAHLVDHDFLTGLLNGRRFQQALAQEVKVASRYHTDVEVLAGADVAMYDAKAAGRNGFAVYRPQSDVPPHRTSRMAEAERIQHALAHDRLVLYCQPTLDLSTNDVTRYELLL